MKKFMIIPVVFFNMSTCMLQNLVNNAKDRAEIIKNSGKTALSKIATPKYSHPPLKNRSLSSHSPPDHKIIDKKDTSIKSFDHSFKEIIPPNITRSPHSQIKLHADRVIKSNRQDKIKEVLATGIIIGLSKIDYCWLYQTIKNFFKSETRTNEA